MTKKSGWFSIAVCLAILAASAPGCGKRGTAEKAAPTPAPAAAPSPGPGRAFFDQGWALTRQERHAEAEPLYRKALEINANDVSSLNNLAWSLAKQGKFEEAVPLFEKALQIDPNYQLARNNLAWAKGELQKGNDGSP